MIEFVPLDLNVHKKDFLLLNRETAEWHYDQFKKQYDMDMHSYLGITPEDIATSSLETYRNIKPPEGIFLLAYIDKKIAGMGAIRKLGNGLGEIKRMYNRSIFRGKGIGKKMVYHLLEKGNDYGCTWFALNTPKFAYAAQHIYKSVGFQLVDFIPEVDIGEPLRPYYLFMEKKLT